MHFSFTGFSFDKDQLIFAGLILADFFHVEHILLHLWKTKYLFRSPERLFWNFCPLKILDYKIKPDMAVVITSAEDELYDWELMCALTFYYDLWNEIINGAQATVAQLYDSYRPPPSLCVFIHTFLAQGSSNCIKIFLLKISWRNKPKIQIFCVVVQFNLQNFF